MKDDLTELVDRFPRVKVLVVGDFILDQFVSGEISRVSREAPVLILKYQGTRSVPGGGANTVANVESLGACAIPLGFVGDDEYADCLLASWPAGLDKSHVFRTAGFQTTRKARILAGSFHSFSQQVARLDHEHPLTLQHHHERRLQESMTRLVPQVNAVVLCDYSLGTLSPQVRDWAIRLATQHEKAIVVDSRDSPHLYSGATSITPNITEIESALSIHLGEDIVKMEEVCFRLTEEWKLKALLVTRGKLGMSLFVDGQVFHIPISGTDEVVDVTGAGDTVTATYATALAAGGSFHQAARLANHAGGIAVMKKRTAAVSPAELRQAIGRHG